MSDKSNHKGLGRGLDVLIPKDFDKSLLLNENERIQLLSVSDIHPNSEQPRRHFDVHALQELAESIKRYGILQPIIVSPLSSGEYILVAGERRLRAAQLALLTRVPAIVRHQKELEQLEVALIENVQRVDLSPLEQAISIEKLHQQFNLTYQEIASRLGKALTTISNIVRLLQLPEKARIALQNQVISEGHARAILSLKSTPQKQAQLLDLIIKNGWSVRQAELYSVSIKEGKQTKKSIERNMAEQNPFTETLSRKLHTPISIKRTSRGGRLEIHFKTDKDLQEIIRSLDNL
ncbi:MAG: ParB/RepB/Spo0J family partition protein [Candidatus Saccharimonadales bacterium]